MVFAWTSVQADDLKVADDFESGDLVSAETFNQIFDTLEKINRTVVDTDLVGVWSCSAIHASTNDWNGWTSKGLLYQVEGVQVNFTASSAATSLESPYSFSTATPTPFWRNSDPATADSGTYQLFNNILIMKGGISGVNLVDWQVDIVSNSRFTLYKNIQNGNQANFIVCDSATAVPAAPTSPTVTNNKTSLDLAWTDVSSDETGFKVYRKLSTQSEAKLVATQTTATYSDTDLTEGQTAYYHVLAYNDNGESAKSKEVSATLDATPPTVVSTSPSSNEQVARTDTTLTITFSEKIEVVCPSDATIGSDALCPEYSKTGTRGTAVLIEGIENGGERFNSADGPAATYAYIATVGISDTITLSGKMVDVYCNGCSPSIPNVNNTLSASQLHDKDTITVTIDKDWIRDANGLYMEADYVFTFTTP